MTSVSAKLRGPLRKRLWARHTEDWYVEPSWCSERLFDVEKFDGVIWDCACGMGRIPDAAMKAGYRTWATDSVDRGYKHLDYVLDFLSASVGICSDTPSNIVSNPPFAVAERFVSKALALAHHKVAMLLPANWVQGDKRSRWMESTPLRRVLFITPRPSMPPGPAIEAGQRTGSGTTDYAWFIWERGHRGSAEIGWLRRDNARTTTLFAPAENDSV